MTPDPSGSDGPRPPYDDGGGDGPGDHERRRLRTARRLLLVGGLLGVLAAGAVGVAGAPGQIGFGVLMLVWALTAATTGLTVLVVAFVDDVRQLPVTRRRVGLAVALLGCGLILAIMGVGAGGAS